MTLQPWPKLGKLKYQKVRRWSPLGVRKHNELLSERSSLVIKFKPASNSGKVWTLGWCPQTIAKKQHLPWGKTSKGEKLIKASTKRDIIDLITIIWCSDRGQVWVGQECNFKGACHPNPESGGGKADNTAVAQTQHTTEIRFAGMMRWYGTSSKTVLKQVLMIGCIESFANKTKQFCPPTSGHASGRPSSKGSPGRFWL